MVARNKLNLKRDLKNVTHELVGLNRQLAQKMILLASQTGETQPLFQAAEALTSSQQLYPSDGAPRENAKLYQSLADASFGIGRMNKDMDAIALSVESYRSAITLASMIGDEGLRSNLKEKYTIARNFLHQSSTDPSLVGVA
ncbi:MAG: hypothetical protein ACPGVT_03100 [Maricaulaceae bacterium]